MTTALSSPAPHVPPTAPDSEAAPANAPGTEEERLTFWEAAALRLDWEDVPGQDKPWHTTHRRVPADVGAGIGPDITWFDGGKLNVAYNCVDRHVAAGRGDKVALHFEGEPGDRRTITYAELQREVSKAANALLDLGIAKGDRVVIYLPVIPETVIITLACARIGAVHSLVFGGFSAEALKFRVEDTRAKLLVTTDGQFRRGTAVPVKDNADAAVSGDNAIEHVLVVNRTGPATSPGPKAATCGGTTSSRRSRRVHEAEAFDAETPLFIMYTSGTTGQPKGLVHTTGGYLTQASFSHEYLFSNPDPARATPTSTGARRTWPGSPRTPTRSTGRSPTASRRSSTRACPTRRTPAATSRSSSATASPATTPRPRWSAR